MRLLTHNLLVCNLSACLHRNIPLILQTAEVTESNQEFHPDLTKRILPKLTWDHFIRTAAEFGHELPPALPDLEEQGSLALLELLHRLLFKIQVQTGQLLCSECGRSYPIERGVPNMVLDEN